MTQLEDLLTEFKQKIPAWHPYIVQAVNEARHQERKAFLSFLSAHDTGIGGLLFTREEYLRVYEALSGQPAPFHRIGSAIREM